jgi:hypothetical protein
MVILDAWSREEQGRHPSTGEKQEAPAAAAETLAGGNA